MLDALLLQPASPSALLGRTIALVALAFCRGGAAVAVATLLSIAPVAAQTDRQDNQYNEQRTDEQKGKDSGAGFRLAPAPRLPTFSRPPAFTRPTAFQRPTMRRDFSRPTFHGGQATIRGGTTVRKATVAKPDVTKINKPVTVDKPAVVNKPVTVDKPAVVNKPGTVDKPAIVDHPVDKPVTFGGQTDRQGSFAGKPDTVSHNPLHNDGLLGKATEHRPQTIEKYGKYYTRNYYSTKGEGETTWYWYDTPLAIVPPVAIIGVCAGDTDDCPLRPMLPATIAEKVGLTICELQWVGGPTGPRTEVECVQGGQCSANCKLHDGDGEIPQPAPLPVGPDRNKYWCGC